MKIIILGIALLIITITSCDSPTEIIDNTQPGRRDYVWTVDTLDPGPGNATSMFEMWGSSPTDVWLVGSGYSLKHAIWHYDGVEWKNVVPDENIACLGLWGFSQNDIWMGTTNSQIWHYDGSKWRKFGTYPYKDFDEVYIARIHGQRPDDIYAVGYAVKNNGSYTAIIMHYNGSRWKYEEFEAVKEVLWNIVVDIKTNIPIISSLDLNSTDQRDVMYKYENSTLTELYRGGDRIGLGNIDGEAIVVIDNIGTLKDKTLYSFNGTSLVKYKDFPFMNFIGSVTGRNSNDIFCGTSEWHLAHYNGTDLKDLIQINVSIARILLFEKDVFVWGRDVDINKDKIFHGRLE
ncbi:MAG: hypothetical protein K8F60_19005 [Melioribacteraceae bacterium]|nr:hypothetical protein [Melioribacteraceae bacterium]